MPVRREGFLDTRTIATVLDQPGSLDLDGVFAAADAAFGPVVRLDVASLMLGPGEDVTNLTREGARGGFLLDLDPPDWRSEWGGLLLFQDAAGQRLQGYRPVPGALTLFPLTARPLISLVMLRAPARTSVLGWWA